MRTYLPALACCVLLVGCTGEPTTSDGSTVPPFIEAGDLDEIRASGKLRILVPVQGQISFLPRSGELLDVESDLARSYAASLGVDPVFVHVGSRDRLISALLEGEGDLVAANMTVTRERKKQVRFTVPLDIVREQVVVRHDDDTVNSVDDLAGRRIALRPSSSFWSTIQALRGRNPKIEIEEVPETLDTEEIIHRVGRGRYDLTVADSNLVLSSLEYRDDIRPAFDLTGDRPIAWAVRPGSPALRESLNRFLTAAQLTARDEARHTNDLTEMKQRRTLRLLTRNDASSYFLWRGELMGFEYELIKSFARRHGMRLEVIVPPTNEHLLSWLMEGRGDLVAAGLTSTDVWRAGGAVFSLPYNFVSQVIVARADDLAIRRPTDLVGRTVHIPRSSPYWSALEELRARGVDFDLEAAPEKFEAEELIDRVAEGEFDLTLVDSHSLGIELTWRDDVRAAFSMLDGIPQEWAVRWSNPELLAALNEYLDREYRGLHYNVVYNKYFKETGRLRRRLEMRADLSGTLSPYDDLIKKYSDEFGFDWRLIVSQMYQESRFKPEAVSFAGAGGLMQVLPNTAESYGFLDLEDPETGILAGLTHMNWVRERFEPELAVKDRMWFTLAAYNAGTGHVRDARRLADSMGLDRNRWFGNVENAMLLLSRSEHARKAPHGYCRCTEPVNYVREIRTRYKAYLEVMGS